MLAAHQQKLSSTSGTHFVSKRASQGMSNNSGCKCEGAVPPCVNKAASNSSRRSAGSFRQNSNTQQQQQQRQSQGGCPAEYQKQSSTTPNNRSSGVNNNECGAKGGAKSGGCPSCAPPPPPPPPPPKCCQQQQQQQPPARASAKPQATPQQKSESTLFDRYNVCCPGKTCPQPVPGPQVSTGRKLKKHKNGFDLYDFEVPKPSC